MFNFFSNKPNLTVFITNFCLMTLELVAGRIIAPYVGVSLYTWTSIIGIILLGITVGNYCGGKIADLFPTKSPIGISLLASAFFSISTLVLLQLIAPVTAALPIPYIIKVTTITFVFFPASMALGLISPMIVKLSLKSTKNTGNTVGKIYASAALGSIVGTYTTGFFIIPLLGVKLIIILVGIILSFISLSFIDAKSLSKKKILIFFTLITFVSAISLVDKTISCFKESNYYCIRIISGEKPDLKYLVLDKIIHSYNDLNDPNYLKYDYIKLFAVFYEFNSRPNPKVLFLGGGGYTLPRSLVSRYKNPDATVVEIDKEVSNAAFKYLGMPQNSTIVTVDMDARMYMQGLNANTKYQLVFMDAFSDFSIPYHLTTKEFSDIIKGHLDETGYLIANVIDKENPGLFIKSYTSTLKKTYNYVYLFQTASKDNSEDDRYNFIVAAGNKPLNFDNLKIAATNLGYEQMLATPYPGEKLDDFLASQKKQIILTDDFAPTDNLLLPVFN